MPNDHLTMNDSSAYEKWRQIEAHLEIIALIISSVENEADKAKIGLNAIAGLVGMSAQQIFHTLDDGMAMAPMVRAVMARLEGVLQVSDAECIGQHTLRKQ